jgi:hypothetical protein
MASSFCVRTSHRDATGRRLSASRTPLSRQRPRPVSECRPLDRRWVVAVVHSGVGSMSVVGHKLTTPAYPRRSALVPTTDVAHGGPYVGYVAQSRHIGPDQQGLRKCQILTFRSLVPPLRL